MHTPQTTDSGEQNCPPAAPAEGAAPAREAGERDDPTGPKEIPGRDRIRRDHALSCRVPFIQRDELLEGDDASGGRRTGMAGTDDLDRRDQGARLSGADAADRPMARARSRGEGFLRLIDGGQVLRKSHEPDIRRKRRFVKSVLGEMSDSATSVYPLPMGNEDDGPGFDEPITAAEAVGVALRKVVPHRGFNALAGELGFSGTTMRRLRDGEGRITEDVLRKLRRVNGFQEVYSETLGEYDNDEFERIGLRLSDSFEAHEAENLVYHLEQLQKDLGAEGVLNMLKAQAKLLADAKPARGKSKANRQIRRKTSK